MSFTSRDWSRGVASIALLFIQELLFASSVSAESSRLELESATNGVFRFKVQNATSGSVNLEGSFDLANWFTLQSATAENGLANLAFTNQEPVSTWFFRSVNGPAPAPIRIGAQADENLSAALLLTPETGGTLTLRDARGIVYEFSASSNLVTEPVAVKMTVITNFTEFPEYNGSRAAVRFSPEGLQFPGEAELRITFPESLVPEEMLAFSFEDSGRGFHLMQSAPGTNEVVMPLSHFSGKGVARFPEGRIPAFDQAYESAKSGIRAAEHRAALLDRAALRELYISETITEAQYQDRVKANRLRKLDEIYRTAVKPFEAAATTDCAIGQAVVLNELERLANLWAAEQGKSYRESPYFPKLAEIAPLVRCACAQRLIDRCELEPGVSGSTLLNSLEDLLLTSRIYTLRTDAQGCDLGSDEEILARLTSGACFGAWEGTITLTEINSRKGSGTTAFSDSWTRTETYENELKKVFTANISSISEQNIFQGNDGKLHEFWSMKLAGRYSVGFRQHEVIVDDFPDFAATETHTSNAAEVQDGTGDTTLSIIDGKFDGLGPGGTAPSLPVSYVSETTYRCKQPGAACPTVPASRTKGTINLFQGYFVGKDDAKLTITQTPTELNLTWKSRKETPQFSGPPEVEEGQVVVSLRRGSPQ